MSVRSWPTAGRSIGEPRRSRIFELVAGANILCGLGSRAYSVAVLGFRRHVGSRKAA